ncbi:nitrous oxide reductase accessory protein NosL [Haloarculaceae archaeon H-GB11]|nr:nitrous oxide reductase accessory protein NosL [Haloarculaceae archaeon H-GB1-1]MEA5388918.1 nitrous oxide reductase accessory protein NosL [Haloarculaceae archaeon H-GB11]
MTRRRCCVGAAAIGTCGLAGCLGGSTASPPPDPISLDGDKTDDWGGMIIGEHFGPNGQIFYAKHSPEGHDNPAWFHTLAKGLFPYHFAPDRQDCDAEAIYVTDYSAVDFEVTTVNGQAFISSHTAAETFGDAAGMTYVMESDVHGGMGPDFLPFSAASDADRSWTHTADVGFRSARSTRTSSRRTGERAVGRLSHPHKRPVDGVTGCIPVKATLTDVSDSLGAEYSHPTESAHKPNCAI